MSNSNDPSKWRGMNTRVQNCVSVFKSQDKTKYLLDTDYMPGIYYTLFIHHVTYSLPQTYRKGVIITTVKDAAAPKLALQHGVWLWVCLKWSRDEMCPTLVKLQSHEIRVVNGSSMWALSLPGSWWPLEQKGRLGARHQSSNLGNSAIKLFNVWVKDVHATYQECQRKGAYWKSMKQWWKETQGNKNMLFPFFLCLG